MIFSGRMLALCETEIVDTSLGFLPQHIIRKAVPFAVESLKIKT
jgi:hypothetical protein